MSNTKFNVLFYESKNQIIPVEQFLDSLEQKKQQKVLAHIRLLEKYGNTLQRHYCAYLQDKIFELRIPSSRNQYRILYFFYCKNNIILTNGFSKKSKKVSSNEIKKALRSRTDFIKRYDKGDILL